MRNGSKTTPKTRRGGKETKWKKTLKTDGSGGDGTGVFPDSHWNKVLKTDGNGGKRTGDLLISHRHPTLQTFIGLYWRAAAF